MAKIPQSMLSNIRKWYNEEQLSMQQMADRAGVSINAISYFMRKNGMPRRSPSVSNRIRFERSPLSFQPAKKLTRELEKLKIMGVMLYWAEGAKKGNGDNVDFANSDPDMIRIFLRFLREVCGIDESRLRIFPYLYANQDVKKIMSYWSRITQIGQGQFTKPYIRKDYAKGKEGRMPHGMIHVRYSDQRLFRMIMQWLCEYK